MVHFPNVQGTKVASVHEREVLGKSRCARCGKRGHWARECNNEPDERGKRSMHALMYQEPVPRPASYAGVTTKFFNGCPAELLLSKLVKHTFVIGLVVL